MAIARSSEYKQVEGHLRGAKPSKAMLKDGGESKPGLIHKDNYEMRCVNDYTKDLL